MLNVRKLLSWFYPSKCPFCKNFINSEQQFCGECTDKFTRHIKQNVLDGSDLIAVSPFKYDGEVKRAIWKFKFNDKKALAKPFGMAVSETVKKLCVGQRFDFITSVPLSNERKKSRGYNQAELFARIISEELNTPYDELLIKTKNNKTQHELSYGERKDNVQGVYAIVYKDSLIGKKILLCDDIVTSGNTMNECALILKKSGAEDVVCAAIAIARRL